MGMPCIFFTQLVIWPHNKVLCKGCSIPCTCPALAPKNEMRRHKSPTYPSMTNLKPLWRWLTPSKKNKNKQPKPHQAPTRTPSDTNDNPNINNANINSHQSERHLPRKPQPAVHRLQELKSPPPIPLSDSPGLAFKSRPLYRRTSSRPASTGEAEGGEVGGRDGG